MTMMSRAPSITPEGVFIPNAFPTVTYVERGQGYEQELSRYLRAPGSVVSVTGRSKSGKTVLAYRVIGADRLCSINCSLVTGPDQFWYEVLQRLGQPSEIQVESSYGTTSEVAGATSGQIGVPLIASARGEASASHATESARSERSTRRATTGVAIDLLIASHKTLLLDDFHYLSPGLQRSLGRQLKDAAFRGVPIVILSVPHHDDDPVQAVPDLRGRVYAIQLASWNESELREIASKGFTALNIGFPEEAAGKLASESIGSPQLMQLLCLEVCNELDVRSPYPQRTEISVAEGQFNSVFRRASRTTNFTTLFRQLETGPRQRGTDRRRYSLRDGTEGDIYRVVLAAIASDPLLTTIPYSELRRRVEVVCGGGATPTGQGIRGTVERMSEIARAHGGAGSGQRDPAMEWLAERGELVLPDAYFLFYLRWEAFPRHSV